MTLPEMDDFLLETVLAPRDEDEARIDDGLARAARQIADTPLVTDRDVALLLEQADAEVERALEDGSDAYPAERVRAEMAEEARIAAQEDRE